MKLLGFSLFFAIHAAMAAQPPVPDFLIRAGRLNQGTWIIELNPPAKHHFNIDAPMKVSTKTGHGFDLVAKEKMRLSFQSKETELQASDVVTASAFLCDDAKTYCVKKQLEAALGAVPELSKMDVRPSKTRSRVGGGEVVNQKRRAAAASSSTKDKHGFWDNRASEAIAEAKKSGKPLLIDFYGIWCPPCNLYNEQVFSKKAFHAIAAKYVLLKMDADRESSFDLKSKFKIGGYPTILIASSDLEEMDRVVGYSPLPEFVATLKRNATHPDKPDIRKQVKLAIEKRETAEAFKKVMAGLSAEPENRYFQTVKLSLEAQDHPEILQKNETVSFLKDLVQTAKKQDTDTLLEVQNLVVGNAERFTGTDLLKNLRDVFHELSLRVNPETLSVPGSELSIADLDSYKMEWATALKDELLIKEVRAHTIESYQRLMKKFNAQDSRGYNLELAYYLWNDGRVKEARAIYDRMIAKYPREFTFYFAASKMFLEKKDLENAKKYAENAVKYAYGDNLIRSTERLLRVLIAQGEKKHAHMIASDFLKAHPKLSGLSVRTNRYLEQIEKAMKDTQL